jgi:AcrR family transcriptional regulator
MELEEEHRGDARRRTTGEVRAAIIDAARALFAERGYGSTSTRDIAARATVAEPLIFRHFGSKNRLFEQVVLAPFTEFVRQYTGDAERRRPGYLTPLESATDYLSRLYDFCTGNREVARAIFMASSHEDVASDLDRAVSDLNALFGRLEKIVEAESARHGLEVARTGLTVRLTFGMVLAVTVLDDWLFDPATVRPDRGEMIAALTGFVLYGAAGRSAGPG